MQNGQALKRYDKIIDQGEMPARAGLYRMKRKGGIDAMAIFPDGKILTARGTHRKDPWMPCWNFIEVTWNEYRSLEEKKSANGGSLSIIDGIIFLGELRKKEERKQTSPFPLPC